MTLLLARKLQRNGESAHMPLKGRQHDEAHISPVGRAVERVFGEKGFMQERVVLVACSVGAGRRRLLLVDLYHLVERRREEGKGARSDGEEGSTVDGEARE